LTRPVWFDVLTPKQARLMASIAMVLRDKLKVDYVVTTRNYDYTISVLKDIYNVDPVVVGGHGSSLLEKLVEDAKRIEKLARRIAVEKPCLLISYPSPSAARIAFGLKIPSIILTDSPHVEPVHRLTLPLADYILVSRFIVDSVKKYALPVFTRIISYNGVDEAEYLRDYKKLEHDILAELGLEPRQYVVIRPPEYKASYYFNLKPLDLDSLALRLSRKIKIVYLPRYPEQYEKMKSRENIIIPPKAIDSIPLAYYAVAVVTGGISMAREAALLGTPAYTSFPYVLDVDRHLISKGIPLNYSNNADRIYFDILTLYRSGEETLKEYRARAKKLLEEMEKPSTKIISLVKDFC